MIYYPISALLNAIASTLVGIIAISKNPKSQLNRSFAYFAFSVAFWSYFYFLWQISNTAESALLWCRILMAGAIFIPSSFLHFSITLIGQRKKYLKTIIFWYSVSLLFLLSDFTPLFVKDVRPRLGFSFWPTAGLTCGLFIAMFAGLTIYAHILMYKSYRKLSGFERNQIKYVFLGTAIGFLGGSTNYPLWYDIPILPIGNALVAVYVLTVAYAISKYRLMDIKVALTRAGIFTIVYLVVLGLPFGLAGWFRPLSIKLLGQNWFWLPMFLLLGLATTGPFIYLYLQRRAEDRLLKEQRRYQDALRKASKDMTLIKDLKRLLKTMVDTLTETIRINYVAIYLFDVRKDAFILKANNADKSFDTIKPIPKDSEFIKYLSQIKNLILLEDLKNANSSQAIEDYDINQIINFVQSINASIVIPTFVDNQMLGFFVLGNKLSGHTYTDDDLAVLSVLANQAALAIENAQFYEQAKIMEAERIQSEKFATIGRLATSAKHEINNPLQMICWNFDNMGLALNNFEANFHNIKNNLDETVNNMKTMIATLANNKTLTPEILSSFDELNILFNKTFSILEKRGAAESEFIKEVNDICSMVDTNKTCLTNACENIKDESIKDTINGIIHSSGTLAKNVLKIKDAANLFRHNIKTAKENAQRIETQTQIMHDLPKELDKELSSIDVNKLMEAAFGYAKQQTYWENLGDTPVEKNIPTDFPKIRGYFSRLQIVFMNLIMNAYQAMTDAGLKSSRDRLIKISANIDPKSDNFLEIHFSNKGPLIPEENLERIFERDFTTKKEGHGLGLHIARIQVELNNGAMHVKNIEGFGPEFIVRLPIWKES